MNLFEGYSGITMSDVGKGYGGMVGIPALGVSGGIAGGVLGGLPGAVAGASLGSLGGSLLGRHFGKKIVDNPDAPIDERKAAHRVGALAEIPTRPYLAPLYIVPGVGPLAAIGSGIGNYVSTADKLGYGTTGKVGTMLSSALAAEFGPLTGLTTPQRISDEDQLLRIKELSKRHSKK